MTALVEGGTFLFEGFHLDRHGLFRRDGRGNLNTVKVGGHALDLLEGSVESHGKMLKGGDNGRRLAQ